MALPLHSEISSVPTNSVGASVITNGDITRDLLRASCNGLAMQIRNFMRYGEEKYTLGLPDGFKVFTDYDSSDVKDIIEAETGREITLVEDFASVPDAIYLAEDHAQRNWGWRKSDDVLQDPPVTGAPDTLVYLDSAASRIRADGTLIAYVRYTSPANDNFPEEEAVWGDYIVTDLSQQQYYYHATYTFNDTESMDPRYWFYDPADGTYPELDFEDDDAFDSPYLPIIPIRKNNQNLAVEANKDTELYITSERLLKKIKMEYVGLGKKIDENPGINGDPNNDSDQGIDHTYVIFGIDVRTERKVSDRYLYRFFEDLSGRGSLTTVDIKDSDYHIRLEFSSCDSKNVSGSIGNVGTVNKIFQGDTLIMQYQTSSGIYREVTTKNLQHRNYIYNNHSLDTPLSASADEDNDNFIIPLNYELAEVEPSMQLREELYQEAGKLVFNAYDRQKLKWYQRSWFKGLLVVVAIVLAVWSSGQSLALLASIFSAYGLVTAIVVGATLAALVYVTSLTFEILAEEFGTIFAVLAVLTILFFTGKYTNNLLPEAGNITAEQLIVLSSNITTATTASVLEGINVGFGALQQNIQVEMDALRQEFEILNDELEEMYKELDSDDYLDPMLFTESSVISYPHESPDDFYNRTIHAGNIGTLALAVPEMYVAQMLKLPEPDYSLGRT